MWAARVRWSPRLEVRRCSCAYRFRMSRVAVPRLRVLLADDHAIVREGLKALISGHPDMEVVGEAADGLAACAKTSELHPDVVVMDVSMPNGNGVQATRDVRRQWPHVRVLALTVHEERSYLREAGKPDAAGAPFVSLEVPTRSPREEVALSMLGMQVSRVEETICRRLFGVCALLPTRWLSAASLRRIPGLTLSSS